MLSRTKSRPISTALNATGDERHPTRAEPEQQDDAAITTMTADEHDAVDLERRALEEDRGREELAESTDREARRGIVLGRSRTEAGGSGRAALRGVSRIGACDTR